MLGKGQHIAHFGRETYAAPVDAQVAHSVVKGWLAEVLTLLGTVGGVVETIGSGAYPQHLPLVVETMGVVQPAIIAHLGYG